jgi:hypothetical protein
MPPSLPAARPHALATLAAFGPRPIVTRVLYKTRGGSATVLAISCGEGLREHTNPDDARAGETIRFPAGVPHAVEAVTDLRMLLVLLHASP